MTMGSPAIWLVYSREHNAWWRPKAAGYTTLIEGAGRYTKDEAEQHCRSRDFAHPDDPPEVACIAPETAAELERAREDIAELVGELRRVTACARMLSGETSDPGTEALAAIYCAEQCLAKHARAETS